MASLSYSEYRQEFPSQFPIIDIAGNDVSDIVINGIYDIDLDDNIHIDDNPNKCSICGKEFKPKTIRKIVGDYELEEVEIITTHKKCEKLKKKIEKLKTDLLNCEFELFCLKSN